MLLVEEGLKGVLKGSTATDAQLSLLPEMQTCSSEETIRPLQPVLACVHPWVSPEKPATACPKLPGPHFEHQLAPPN